jgi:hypothetical protein
MKRAGLWLRGLAGAACLGAAWGALAGVAGSCESEASAAHSAATPRYFLVLAASTGVFYNRSGPSFVMLMKAGAGTDESAMGAVGIYANHEGSPVFGAVPWQVYDAFLHEPEKKSQDVMLRLEINEPQYQRVLGVLRGWEKRARENELLYPDEVFMNNILLVKQATEELNRCRQSVNLYQLDWGVNDRISDNNPPSRVPYLVFAELKRLNADRHVSDSHMPQGLASLAGAEPLPVRPPAPGEQLFTPVPASASEHANHMHHVHEPADAAH